MNIYWSDSQAAYADKATSAIADGVLAEIASFAELPPGWHYGEGAPIPQRTIAIATSIVEHVRQLGIGDIDAFAGCGGEISLVLSYSEFEIEAIVESDGSVSVACDLNGSQVSYKACLVYSQAINEISSIVGKAWSTSGYFIREITISDEIDLTVWPSVTYPGAYPWSNMIAYEQPAQAFRFISAPTMITLPRSRPFFGSSTDQYYPAPIR